MKYTFMSLKKGIEPEYKLEVIADSCKLKGNYFELINARLNFHESNKMLKSILIKADDIDLVGEEGDNDG